MSPSRGRPTKISNEDLKQILLKYATKHQGQKISSSQLEKDTGIKRHVWMRRMKSVIDQLNEPTAVLSKEENTLPLPNITELIEKHWNHKTGLIKALSHYNETLQDLFEQAKRNTIEVEKTEQLLIKAAEKDRLIKELKTELKHYKNLYYEVAVKSTYHAFQEEEGLKNVISINKIKEKGLSIDFVASYPELFNENEEEDENDED